VIGDLPPVARTPDRILSARADGVQWLVARVVERRIE
jgi:hypothetical protein